MTNNNKKQENLQMIESLINDVKQLREKNVELIKEKKARIEENETNLQNAKLVK